MLQSCLSVPAMVHHPPPAMSLSSVPPPLMKEGGCLDLIARPSHEFEVMDHRQFLNNELNHVLNRLQLEVYGANDGDQCSIKKSHQMTELYS